MKTILLAASAALLTSTAFAADAVMIEPAPIAELAPVGDWTGFYAGVQLGGAFGNSGELSLDPFTAGLQTAFSPGVNPAGDFIEDAGFDEEFNSGFTGGVHVGYDHHFSNNVVLGAILDVSYYDISDEQIGRSRTPATYTIERELDYLATLRGRLGYAFTPRVMGYVTGGLAYGEVDFSYSQPGSRAAFTTSGGQEDDIGYTVGAGVEALVTERISLGVEYLYTDLGDNDFEAQLVNGAFGGPAGAPGSNPGGTTLSGSDDDFDFHTVQMKLSYRF